MLVCKFSFRVVVCFCFLRDMATLLSRPHLWKSPALWGDARWHPTQAAPAPSPHRVTLSGSPPKWQMWACTQRRARFWSHRA